MQLAPISQECGTWTDGAVVDPFLARVFPEAAAGGFTRLDGTIQFYTRINALLRPGMTVVDYGAGRGAALHDDPCHYRRELRLLRGKVAKVIGLDVDPVVRTNPGLDEAYVIDPDGTLPLADASVDLIVSDYTFEHISAPERCAAELKRILRPGGWLCARTPNRWNYVAVAARLIPERLHGAVLRRAQPNRKSEDVFPTCYRMNDLGTLRGLFPATVFSDASYTISAEPAYLPRRTLVWRAALTLDSLMPGTLRSNILLLLRKHSSDQ